MIAKILVFVCAAVGLVAGSCFEIRAPQEYSPQIISLPVSSESSFSAPVISENVFSSGSSDIFSSGSSPQVISLPGVNVFSSSPIFTSSVGSENVFSSGSSGAASDFSGFSSGSSDFSGFSSGSGSFGVQATNGPEASPVTVVQAPSVTLPAVQSPVVTVSSDPIPAPRVLSQRCICTKTIVKPQIIQRQVNVPKIQRYLKRTVTPVVENVAYKSTPVTRESGASSVVVPGSVSGSGFSGSSSPVGFSSGCGSFSQGEQFVSSYSPVLVSSGSFSPRLCSC